MDLATFAEFGIALAAGGFLGQVWQTVFGRKREKLNEAEVLSRISGVLREEIRQENEGLKSRMDMVVAAVTGLTDLLDDFFPKITGLSTEERIALRQRINLAKRIT